MLSENEYMMWFSALGHTTQRKKEILLKLFGSAGEIFKASRKTIEGIKGLSEVNINDICSGRDEDELKKYAESVYSDGIDYIIKGNSYYPPLLLESYDPPLGLYIRGDKEVLLGNTVSMVGTRKATSYGMAVARSLGKEFAENGAVVVSGMADGIDSASHRGALDGGGKTIAVFGCGVNVCYPKTNSVLMDRIIKDGCVISEYPINEKATARYFPHRNRIIAAMSMATVVVEAESKGGSLITANLALDFGREVFAVPGNITSRASEGTNGLIKAGADVLTCAEDVFSAIGIEKKREEPKENKNSLENNEKMVYDCINSGVSAVDEIMYKTGFDMSEVQLILLTLEINGNIRKLPGSKYICI